MYDALVDDTTTARESARTTAIIHHNHKFLLNYGHPME